MKAVYNLVGMRFHPGATDLLKKLPNGEPLVLLRDPNNPYDAAAIQVHARGHMLGHLKANAEQKQLAKRMDVDGAPQPAAKLVAGMWPQVEVDE
jgi:hypothetical protein